MLDRRSKRHIRDRARIRRSLSIVPSLFTVGNIFCGYYSIISTLRGNWDYAAVLIGVGYVLDGLDGLDGSVAKHVHQLGSLATFAFVMCGALRLARFNVQTKKPSETSSKRNFVG